jgi:hypothetical protein
MGTRSNNHAIDGHKHKSGCETQSKCYCIYPPRCSFLRKRYRQGRLYKIYSQGTRGSVPHALFPLLRLHPIGIHSPFQRTQAALRPSPMHNELRYTTRKNGKFCRVFMCGHGKTTILPCPNLVTTCKHDIMYHFFLSCTVTRYA